MIKGKQLSLPQLQLGRHDKIDEHKATSFMLFNKPLYSSEIFMKIGLICPSDFDISQIKSLMQSTCKNLDLGHQLVHLPIRFQDSRTTLKNIEQSITRSDNECNIFWFILPNSFKLQYGSLKKLLLSKGI